jgi:hypothetical protein
MLALDEAETVFRRVRDVSHAAHTLQSQRKSSAERHLVINNEDGECRRHDAHMKGSPVAPVLLPARTDPP